MPDLLLANPNLEPKTTNDSVICIRHLNYYFGRGDIRKQILFDINLDLFKGQTVVLTGPSGSGKTTLLTLIGALRSGREGSLKVLDRELVGLSELALVEVRRKIGFIFQAHNLFDSLTAVQNVELAVELGDRKKRRNRNYKRQKREIAVEILTKLGLGHRIDYKPNALSGGQKQRVSVARALVNQPSLILADEPTAALDRSSSLEVLSMMQNLVKERGGTLLLVTHDSRVLELADTVISLDDGRLSQAKGELLRSISSLVSSILEMDTGEIANTVRPLSTEQFSKFLDKLNNEFSQLLNTMNLLESHSLGNKLELIIQTLSLKIAQILNAQQVTFFVVDRENQKLWSKNARGKDGELISIEIPIDAGIAGSVAMTGKSVNIPDPYNDSRFNPQIDRDTGFLTRNLICLPMFNEQNEVFAVVQVLNKKGDLPFDREDEKRFLDLVQSLGLVLQSSIVYAKQGHSIISQNLKSDPLELKRKIAAFSVDRFIQFLEELTRDLIKINQNQFMVQDSLLKNKLDNLRGAIVLKMAQILQAETVTLFIVNRDKQTLRADNALGQDGKRLEIEIPLDTGIAGYVAKTGQPAIVNDPHHNPYFNSHVDRETGFKTRNILSLPIIDSQSHEVIAVVQALNKLNNAKFDTEDRDRFLEAVNAIGGALPYSIDTLQKSFTYL
ncbi:MAG: ATP-binding cassette domain-containing protein [Cyanobacteria bacterium SBLK]|nr:ATP-binding cassette domain-containing protein [Cyanobacteria bacterium SBLK]